MKNINKVFVIVKKRETNLLLFMAWSSKKAAKYYAETNGYRQQDYTIHELSMQDLEE